MATYKISGGKKLQGSVQIQGSKNSAMKHLIVPLLTCDQFFISNVPNITSCTNLLEIVKLAGGKVDWLDKHSVAIDTRKLGNKIAVDETTFFHTSAGWLTIPLLLAAGGECVIENMANRSDTGGDQIGRKLDFSWYGEVGIGVEKLDNDLRFFTSSTQAFSRDVKSMFGPTVFSLFCALQRDGQSRIQNANNWPEFYDTLGMLSQMGAEVAWQGKDLMVNGQTKLHGCSWENMNDRHDVVTWISLAASTESELTIVGVQDRMELGPLWEFLSKVGLDYKIIDETLTISAKSVNNLRSVSQECSYKTGFTSEWQVLFSPLLAQIPGESAFIDKLNYDRMWHWQELEKMGAKFEFFTPLGLEIREGKARAVKITGENKLIGTKVEGLDLRSTAALLIAGLSANGQTEVIDAENNLERGYENFIERTEMLGADIQAT